MATNTGYVLRETLLKPVALLNTSLSVLLPPTNVTLNGNSTAEPIARSYVPAGVATARGP